MHWLATFPSLGGADGTIRQLTPSAPVDNHENDALLPGDNRFDRSEPAITIVQREFDVFHQTATDVPSVGCHPVNKVP